METNRSVAKIAKLLAGLCMPVMMMILEMATNASILIDTESHQYE